MCPGSWLSEIKQHRRLAMPQATHASRLWLSECDAVAAAARILASDAALHVGHEYLLTGTERIDFTQLAELLGEVLR